jgi:hypothetical protein
LELLPGDDSDGRSSNGRNYGGGNYCVVLLHIFVFRSQLRRLAEQQQQWQYRRDGESAAERATGRDLRVDGGRHRSLGSCRPDDAAGASDGDDPSGTRNTAVRVAARHPARKCERCRLGGRHDDCGQQCYKWH